MTDICRPTTITELSILNNRDILPDSDPFGLVHGHVNRDKLVATLAPHRDMRHVRSEMCAPSTGIPSTRFLASRSHFATSFLLLLCLQLGIGGIEALLRSLRRSLGLFSHSLGLFCLLLGFLRGAPPI